MSADTLAVGCPGALSRGSRVHTATATRRADGDGWVVRCTACSYQARQTTAESARLDARAEVEP